MMERMFPFLIIGLMVCASIPYFYVGDWRRGVFWFVASILNLVVTI